MATNNAVNISGSGIVSYDGAGSFSALANPLTVSNGGQGNSSLVAYAPLCGGTSSTNPIQSVASLGYANQILTSNGASALPSFQATGAKYTAFWRTTEGNPSDSTTYFLITMSATTAQTTSGNAASRVYLPQAGTITAVYGAALVKGTLGSAGSSTIALRLNNSSDTTVTSSLAMTAASNTFNNTGLSIAVVPGDYIECKLTTPSWATNPTQVDLTISVLIS